MVRIGLFVFVFNLVILSPGIKAQDRFSSAIESKYCEVKQSLAITNFSDLKPDFPDNLAEHIGNLGSPSFSIREYATKQLVALDLSLLKSTQFADAFETTDAEVRARVYRIRASILQKHRAGIRHAIISASQDNLRQVFPKLRAELRKEFSTIYRAFRSSVLASGKIDKLLARRYSIEREGFVINDLVKAFQDLKDRDFVDEVVEIEQFPAPHPQNYPEVYRGKTLSGRRQGKPFWFYGNGRVVLSLPRAVNHKYDATAFLKTLHSKPLSDSDVLKLMPCVRNPLDYEVKILSSAEITLREGTAVSLIMDDIQKFEELPLNAMKVAFKFQFQPVNEISSQTGNVITPTAFVMHFSKENFLDAEENFRKRSFQSIFKI